MNSLLPLSPPLPSVWFFYLFSPSYLWVIIHVSCLLQSSWSSNILITLNFLIIFISPLITSIIASMTWIDYFDYYVHYFYHDVDNFDWFHSNIHSNIGLLQHWSNATIFHSTYCAFKGTPSIVQDEFFLRCSCTFTHFFIVVKLTTSEFYLRETRWMLESDILPQALFISNYT